MVLIISESTDTSTEEVISWLNYFKKKYIRIDTNDKLKLEYVGADVIFETDFVIFKLSQVSAYWYRRGELQIVNDFTTNIDPLDNLQYHENKVLTQYIYYMLGKLKNLNTIENADKNKLIINDIAKSLNIMVPKDLLFSKLEPLETHIKNSGEKYITKLLSGRCIQKFKDFSIFNYTTMLELKKITTNSFFPSLIQNYIPKKYELRIFYIDSKFYTMAIFSQESSETKVDFRNYNEERPNRTVPFKLPKEIEKKLNLLMIKLELKSGSLDMIVTLKGEFVFLEVNPVGQFGMVSFPCNYNLEKKIAAYL